MKIVLFIVLCTFSLQAQLNIIPSSFVGKILKPAVASGSGGQTQTDDFNRADNTDLGANWTTVTSDGAIGVSGNAAAPAAVGSDSAEYYSGVAWTDNQSSEVKVTEVDCFADDTGAGVCVRASSSARTYYRLTISDFGNHWEVGKRVAGTYTALLGGSLTYSAGSILKLSAIGTTISGTYGGSAIFSTNDTSISSGSPGLSYSSSCASASMDDWAGNDGL